MELKIYNYQGVVNEDYNVANTPAPPGKVIYSLFCCLIFGLILRIWCYLDLTRTTRANSQLGQSE